MELRAALGPSKFLVASSVGYRMSCRRLYWAASCDRLAESCLADQCAECWETACDESNVGFDDGPEEAVRGYTDYVVCGHAHDVHLI